MHTPGPWTIRICEQGRNWLEINGADRKGVVIGDYYEKRVNGETEVFFGARINPDDARLIAAAPDLLEACGRLVDAIENGGSTANVLLYAKHAISKALNGPVPAAGDA